jgi:hypothetical protein
MDVFVAAGFIDDDPLAIIRLRSRPAPCTQWTEETGVVPTGCDKQHYYQVDVKMDLGIPHIDTPDQHYNAYPGHYSLLSRLFMCAGLQAPIQARVFLQSL